MIGHSSFTSYEKSAAVRGIAENTHRLTTKVRVLNAPAKTECAHDLVEAFAGPLWSDERRLRFKTAVVTVCYLCGESTTQLSDEHGPSDAHDPGGL